MHRKGHMGVTLLAYAPVAYILIHAGKPGLALLSWIGIQAVEPLPDQDFLIPGMSHREVSHSVITALIIGIALGGAGWLLGGQVIALSTGSLSAGGSLWSELLSVLPEASAQMLSSVAPNAVLDEISGATRQRFVGVVDRQSLALFGFGVGVYGILAHLLGDVITKRGVRPLQPFSDWGISLSSLRADNPVANTGLLGLGVLVILVVLLTSSPAVGAAATAPALGSSDLSPIDIAAGQPQNQSADQTSNQSQGNGPATVEFANQTSDGATVTIKNATLPNGGFVALHDSEYLNGRAPADSSIIAVSEYLSAGENRNVTVNISNAPPGNYPGLNQSRLNTSQSLAAVVYRDSDGNKRFDYVRTVGENDTAYKSNGEPAVDEAGIRVPSAETKLHTASVTVQNQTLRNETLVVEKVRLPDGGFLIAHNQSYQRTSDPLTSIAGVSRYLSPGNHMNVALDLRSDALSRSQVVTVQPSLDTNDNQRYDFVRSAGFQDVGYTTLNRSEVVTETAQIRLPSSEQTTQTQPESSSLRATENPSSTTTRTVTQTDGPPEKRSTSEPQADSGKSNAPLGLSAVDLIGGSIAVVAVLAVLPSAIRKLQ